MRRARSRHSILSVLAGVLLWSSAARAQVPGEEIARRAFEEGVTLEKKGDFAAALAKFKESEQIKATLGNRYHKAYCLEMTGKLAAALIEYEAVEKAANDSKKTDLVQAARMRLEPLRTRVPQLAVRLAASAPKDVEASLDGTPLALALLDGKAFRVDPGEHVVTARARAREPFTKRVATAEGSTSEIEIVFPPLPSSGQEPAPPTGASNKAADATSTSPAASEPPRSRTLPIITTAGAIVLAGAGVASFLVAGQKQEEREKTATRTFDALALGSWVGAAGLAALSVVLWTSSPSRTASAAHARVVARSSWIGLEGRF